MAVVAYRTVDAALNFYNIQDECRHFNEAVMNGVNCIWDVGTTIAAWGGGAKKINNAINEITARYDKKGFLPNYLTEVGKETFYLHWMTSLIYWTHKA